MDIKKIKLSKKSYKLIINQQENELDRLNIELNKEKKKLLMQKSMINSLKKYKLRCQKTINIYTKKLDKIE